MNILQKAINYVRYGNLENQIRNKFNEAFLWGLGGGYTQYDVKNKTYLTHGYQYNPIVYSVIKQQATKSASIPYYIKQVEDKGSHRKLKLLDNTVKGNYSVQQQIKRIMLESKAYKENEMAMPLERPNISQTWGEFIALYKTFLSLTGNAYIFMLSPDEGMNAGMPIQVYLLPSHMVQIVVKKDAPMLGVEDPVKSFLLVEGRSYVEFMADDVIHVKYSNPDYGDQGEHLYGQSPLRAALRNIQSSNEAIDLNIKTLKSGGAYGFIHAKGTALTETQAKEIKERMLEMDASPENLSKIAAVSTEMGFTRISLTTDELKPFDYLKFDQKQICNVLGWDDKLLNSDEGAKYDNIAHARKRVITDNIAPDLNMLAEALNSQFLPRFKGYENTCIEFDYMELPEMQTDTKDLVEWLGQALDRGVVTRNEFRLAISYIESEDENMNKYTVNMNTMSLDEALDPNFNIE